MNLSQYMKRNSLNDREMAERIGVERSVVTKLRSNRIRPSIETAVAIIKATSGAVSLDSFLEPRGKPQPTRTA
jgi:transcriptional regulator with XRE-family HTH domain